MVYLKFKDIPQFLHDSRRYEKLKQEMNDNDEINIYHYFSNTENVYSIYDFIKMLSIIEYWDFYKYPLTLIIYAKDNIEEVLSYLYQNMDLSYILQFLKYILPLLEIKNLDECKIVWKILVKDQNMELPQNWCNYCMDNKEKVFNADFLNEKYIDELRKSKNFRITYYSKYFYRELYIFLNIRKSLQEKNMSFPFRFNTDILHFNDAYFYNKNNFELLIKSIINNHHFTLTELYRGSSDYREYHCIEFKDNFLTFLFIREINKKLYKKDVKDTTEEFEEEVEIEEFEDEEEQNFKRYVVRGNDKKEEKEEFIIDIERVISQEYVTLFNKMNICEDLKNIIDFLDKQDIIKIDYPTIDSLYNANDKEFLDRISLLNEN
jgi:hypothetical protein